MSARIPSRTHRSTCEDLRLLRLELGLGEHPGLFSSPSFCNCSSMSSVDGAAGGGRVLRLGILRVAGRTAAGLLGVLRLLLGILGLLLLVGLLLLRRPPTRLAP